MSPAAKEPGRSWISLPQPDLAGRMTLEQALARRRSIRCLQPRRLDLREIGQLLWAIQGVSGPGGDRTAPSAGALFPLETYVATPEGLYHYHPDGHRLATVAAGDLRGLIFRAGLSQEPLDLAPAIFALTGVIERTASRYGRSRSPRYVHMEAGHAAQNLLLQATAMGLGAVVIGAFEDDELRRVLALPRGQRPLYLIPVGDPAAPPVTE